MPVTTRNYVHPLLARSVAASMVAVLAITLGACGGPERVQSAVPGVATSRSPTGEGARAIADALNVAGVSCENFSSRAPTSNVADAGACSIGDDDVIIRTFLTPEDRDRYIEASGLVVDQLSFDLDAPPQLMGPTWIVTTDTRATAQKIRQVIGGELR